MLFVSRIGDNDDEQLHSTALLMSSIRYCDAGECLLTCYSSLFLPPLECADTGLLSNTSAGYGQTVKHSFTCRHTWKAQELWRKRIMSSSTIFYIQEWRRAVCLEIQPSDPDSWVTPCGAPTPQHTCVNSSADPYLIFGDCVISDGS